MKKTVILLIVLLLLLAVYYLPIIYQTQQNVQNSRQINVGMKKNEVLEIMGEPDSRRLSYFDETDSLYYYQPPFGASSGIEIIFDNDGKVKQILPYE